MTVITAMRFNKESGGMVADSQGSTDIRKYDLFTKATVIGDRVIIGGTGSSAVLSEAGKKLVKAYDGASTTYQSAMALGEIFHGMYRGFINQTMLERFGFSSKDFLTGKLVDGTPIGPHLLQPAWEVYVGNDDAVKNRRSNEAILIGRDNDDFRVYRVAMTGQIGEWPLPFAAAGSGSDEADNILHAFLRSIPRDQRSNIDFVEGMGALIGATNHAVDLNNGVGGIPTIAYVRGEKSATLSEQSSLLASEIVRVYDERLVDKEKALEGLNALLTDDNKWEEVEKKLFQQSPRARDITRFLRGYRIN